MLIRLSRNQNRALNALALSDAVRCPDGIYRPADAGQGYPGFGHDDLVVLRGYGLAAFAVGHWSLTPAGRAHHAGPDEATRAAWRHNDLEDA